MRATANSTEPQDARLDVFTAKVCSSNESLFVTQNNGHDCLRCQLWNIANPRENLRCEDCTREAFATSEAIVCVAEQPKTTTAQLRLNIISEPPSRNLSQPKGTGRCSACEISALIGPDQAANCTSCDPNTELSSPSSASQLLKVKRSSARRPPTKLELHATRCLQGWLKDNRNNRKCPCTNCM